MTKAGKLEQLSKKGAIDEISPVLAKYLWSVEKAEYRAFYNRKKGWLEEMVIVHFRGGGVAVRNVSINSILVNFDEVVKLCHGGHYDEVEWYRSICKDPEWEDIFAPGVLESIPEED